MRLNEFLKLTRPLASYDLETTGVDAKKDRIVQMGLTMHYPDKPEVRWWTLVRPGIPVPPGLPHKIDDAMLNGCQTCFRNYQSAVNAASAHETYDHPFLPWPEFKDFAAALAPKLLAADLLGYSADFDLEFTHQEMKRAGVPFEWEPNILDPKKVWMTKVPRTLTDAVQEFGGPRGLPKGLDGPSEPEPEYHDAVFDVEMAEVSLHGQLLRWPDLPRTVPELADAILPPRDPNWIDREGKFAWGPDGQAIVNFGKEHLGRRLREVQRKYLHWMVGAAFKADTKRIAREALEGRFPVKKP